MCVLFLYYYPDGSRPYKLIIASNRDEFYDRLTIPAQFWSGTASHLIAGGWGFVWYKVVHVFNILGKDCVNGGTWLGMTRYGKFAVLTNYRKHVSDTFVGKSRGYYLLTLFSHQFAFKRCSCIGFFT